MAGRDGLVDVELIDEGFVPRRRLGVVVTDLDGETVLRDEHTGRDHVLNQTGQLVWECLDGSGSLGDLATDLSDELAIDRAVVLADVTAMVRDLGAHGLLEGVRPSAPAAPPVPSRPSGLEEGAAFTSFELPAVAGGTISLADHHGRKVLLVNWSPACGYCDRIAGDLNELRDDLFDHGVDILLVASGSVERNKEKVSELRLEVAVTVDTEGSVAAFTGLGTPAAYLLDEEGRVARPLALGALEVPALARELAGKPVS